MLILASRSPRRHDLLLRAGYDFQVIPADEQVEDQRKPGESPSDFVKRLAEQKARNVAEKIGKSQTGEKITVLGCDTVVSLGDVIFGKPSDRVNAGEILRSLSGQKHMVLTGISLAFLPEEKIVTDFACTELRMEKLTDEQIEEYLDSDQWKGKAGAFGYQDRNDWLQITDGSESNVVGLPMELLQELLHEIAIR